jgi:putative membrane protein
MNRTTPLVLTLAVAAALAATACHRNDNQNADTTAGAGMATAATTPPPVDSSAGAMAGADAYGNAGAATTPTGPITDTDFYAQALDSGRKEVAAATLGTTTASDAGVKSFADMLVKDHTAMNQKVAAAAGQSDAAAPAPDASATADLQGKSGADFDRAFVDKMVTDHQNAIALFENAAQNASTDQAKSLAQDALPKLRAHLQTAQDLQGKLGGGTGSMGSDGTGNPGT